MNELALFAGAGGGILGGKLLGWRTVCAVEWEPYPAAVLCARQNDGILPPCPVWDDVRTFDGHPWHGIVDVVSGGFPCQDISSAGQGAGIDGERSGLWREMHRIICEVRPRFAYMENSPMLTSRGLGRVLGDLAASGYDAAWCVLGADDAGAPHVRKRIWILAVDATPPKAQKYNGLHNNAVLGGIEYACGAPGNMADSDLQRCESKRQSGKLKEAISSAGCRGSNVPHADMSRREEQWERESDAEKHATAQRSCKNVSNANGERWGQMESLYSQGTDGARAPSASLQCAFAPRKQGWWLFEPNVGRVAHGVAARVDRLKALGNGQVPAVAAMAFRILYKKLLGVDYNPCAMP